MGQIVLDGVSLTFQVRRQAGRLSLKELMIRRLLGQQVKPLVKVRALRDLNLHIGGGERVGLLGHNGAGKSTLLRLLAGIYLPTRGTRLVQGRVSSLFDVFLGFDLEASGWDNIYYRGYLQRETPRSMDAKARLIADFSELGDFLHLPVRCYSTGMLVRLGFSIASTIEPEVLLVDEVLNVGDEAFQVKARRRLADMMGKADLMVMVSHDLGILAQLCERGIWLEQGRVRMDGPIAKVIDAYLGFMHGPRPDSLTPVGAVMETVAR